MDALLMLLTVLQAKQAVQTVVVPSNVQKLKLS